MDGWLGRTAVFMLLAVPAIAQQISFKPAVNYPVPVPVQMVAADFNHDGKVDVVVITLAPSQNTLNNFAFFAGNGDGTLQPPVTFSIPGAGADTVAAADFNGDGNLDLVFAQGTSTPFGFGNQVSVFLGDGKGGFTLSTHFTTGGTDTVVAIGDFNLDGKPDLAIASWDAWEIFLYLGVGDGTFVGAGTLSAFGDLAVADLNNDGNPDIVATVHGGSAILVFPGDGTGNFGPPVSLPVGTNPSWVAIGDFNGDGKPDIACTIDSSASVTVLLNQGGFSFASAGNLQVGNQPDGKLVVADFNHDGNLDVATFNFSGSVTVLTGDGSGHLGNRFDIPISLWANGGAAPDLNGDGLPDLVVPDQIKNAVSVLINNTARLYNVCLLYDPTKAVKSGATIPIKLQLCDSSGNDESSSSVTVHAISITGVSASISGTVEDSGNANPDNNFRFDATLGTTGGYIFNLKTTGLSTGKYNVNFTVTGDSSAYAAAFQVK
jgi:hypothetical protein